MAEAEYFRGKTPEEFIDWAATYPDPNLLSPLPTLDFDRPRCFYNDQGLSASIRALPSQTVVEFEGLRVGYGTDPRYWVNKFVSFAYRDRYKVAGYKGVNFYLLHRTPWSELARGQLIIPITLKRADIWIPSLPIPVMLLRGKFIADELYKAMMMLSPDTLFNSGFRDYFDRQRREFPLEAQNAIEEAIKDSKQLKTS